MVLKISSPKAGNLSASDYVSDPEEKEISDDDDDDRNHKHRRRDARSQSSDKDALEQVATRPFKKHNKSFANGHTFRENESQPSQSWNNYNTTSERHFSGKFERRNPESVRANFDLSQRNRGNQAFSGDPGPGRGRGRDSGAWNNRNYRFTSADLSSQMVPLPRGTIPSSLFPERGLPNVANAQGAPWGGYGLVSGLPNGGVDALHPIGLPGPFRPPISSSLGIPRQRCRDFEERGFCLRGDMCPMEHGINRIVVEDVQSLSQFNLPVSLSSGHILGTPAVPGSLPSVGVTSSLMNNKGAHGRNGKHGMADEGLVNNGAFSDSPNVAGADVYDPDQPLWNNNGPETSSAHIALRSSPFDETETLSNDDVLGHHIRETADIERLDRTGLPVGSQATGSSVWGRIRSSKGSVKREPRVKTLDNREDEIKENQETFSNHGKQPSADGADPKAPDSSKLQSDAVRLTRKPTQKALRTLFVNGVPQKNNKREALLAHFQKFGKVIDIYIPANSERAFVQFSKREEAEAALRAPDAVMGNRFIKLWWANRDSIPDDGVNSAGGVSSIPHIVKSSLVPTDLSIPNKGKDNLQPAVLKASDVPTHDGSGSHSDPSKLSAITPKVPPPLQKKLENLEQLKEELRKKQEMLDRKRNDFKRQLDKLEKQAGGVKGEAAAEQVPKRQKVGVATDHAKTLTLKSSESAVVTPRPSNSSDAVASSHEEVMDSKSKLGESNMASRPDTSSSLPRPEPSSLKQQSRLPASTSMSFFPNRYKLDNRPTTFRISPPLPAGLANVAALKEHFSSYGDITILELEDIETHEDADEDEMVKNCSARIGFRERHTAERAFSTGKCWQGHNLQFVWMTASALANDNHSNIDKSAATMKKPKPDIQSAEKVASASLREPDKAEPEHVERQKVGEHTESDEVPVSGQSLLSTANGQQESPKR